jgi:hypothetical protein
MLAMMGTRGQIVVIDPKTELAKLSYGADRRSQELRRAVDRSLCTLAWRPARIRTELKNPSAANDARA